MESEAAHYTQRQEIALAFKVSGTTYAVHLHGSEQKMAISSAEKKRILFVDNNDDEHELVSLTLAGYGIVIARDFNEGLRLARQRYFDLYILDNSLPDGNGVELCHLIREFDPYTPIVFLSSAASESDAQEALTAGANIYITKPIAPDELERAVTQLTLAASAMSLEARQAELAVIREEIRSREDALRIEEAEGKRLPAEEDDGE
jgi:DNA-binding response OmpR family regulator